ncbi:MAG: amidohydrolase family protein [Desulfobacterales bacterium]|nr:amidohydrolase family protein [Desulfobacterales bacterium]
MIDFHTHIFSPYARDHRDQLAKADPAFSLIYAEKKARMIGVEELLEAMEENGVEQSVVCGFPWQGTELSRRENAYLLESAHRYPDRIIPFITLPQDGKAAIAELDQCARAGAQGIGEMAPGTYGDHLWPIETMRPLFAAIKEKGLPVLIHCNEPLGHPYPGKGKVGPAEMGTLVDALQGITIILAHWGGGFFFYELMPEIADICKGVYYDTAASPFLYNRRIYPIAISIIGPQRILFGSDYPLIPPARYKQEMQEAGLAEKELEAILGSNAQRLLGR